MNTSTIKSEILAAISSELDTWLPEQLVIKDGYKYETHFMEFAQKINRTILEKSMGSLPSSRNKKNFIPVLVR